MRVIKVNKKRGNIVLSRKALLEEENAEKKKTTLETLAEGKTLRGTVKNITDYGAFIDLGGIDGLLHITDMSWGRVGHPSELFKVNDEVDVTVLKYDPSTERGIKYDDPAIGIEWPDLELTPSERDATAPLLSEIADELPFQYER